MSRYALIQDAFNGLKSLQEEASRDLPGHQVFFNPAIAGLQNLVRTTETPVSSLIQYRRRKNDL